MPHALSCYVKLLFILILPGFSLAGQAQNRAMSAAAASERGLSLEELYLQYPKAITDKTDDEPVFKGAEDVCYTAYVKFISEFAAFLKQQNFRWGRATRCNTQIFFSSDGQVEYFIYEFAKGALSAERMGEYERLLNQFLQSFCFRVTGERSFSMSGYITFKDLH